MEKKGKAFCPTLLKSVLLLEVSGKQTLEGLAVASFITKKPLFQGFFVIITKFSTKSKKLMRENVLLKTV